MNETNIGTINVENDVVFEETAVPMDSYCVDHDMDEYDLYGERMIEDGPDSDICFE